MEIQIGKYYQYNEPKDDDKHYLKDKSIIKIISFKRTGTPKGGSHSASHYIYEIVEGSSKKPDDNFFYKGCRLQNQYLKEINAPELVYSLF